MPKYRICLHYPNGSVSHRYITSSAIKARVICTRIFQDDDLREFACRLEVCYGDRILFNAPPSSIPYDDCEDAIIWPRGAPKRLKTCVRVSVTLPLAIVELARKTGNGNVSRGLLELVIEGKPDLEKECFTLQAVKQRHQNNHVPREE